MEDRRLFQVWFQDGNEKLLEAENMVAVINYLVYVAGYTTTDIVCIEERKGRLN